MQKMQKKINKINQKITIHSGKISKQTRFFNKTNFTKFNPKQNAKFQKTNFPSKCILTNI